MTFDPSAYIPQGDISELLNSISISLGAGGNSFLLGIAAYVLLAMGLYAIAKRRAIHHPWMAWVPGLNVWILGSIADQYRYVTKGQVRNSRKALIVLEILKFLAVIAVIVTITIGVVQLVSNISRWENMQGQHLFGEMLRILVPLLIAFGIWAVIALIKLVVTTVAYYDLFASCEPQNKVLFLVLGLLIGILMPVFVFASREKDLGMPARKAPQQPEAEVLPPVEESPAEPWTSPEE